MDTKRTDLRNINLDICVLFPPLILIFISIIFLIYNLSSLGWATLWYFILIPAIAGFFTYYFLLPHKARIAGVTFSIISLVIVGTFSFYMSLVGWYGANRLWPIFLLAFGISLLASFYSVDKDDRNYVRNSFVSGVTLLFFAVLFLIYPMIVYKLWPLFLFIVGLSLIISHIFANDDWKKVPCVVFCSWSPAQRG